MEKVEEFYDPNKELEELKERLTTIKSRLKEFDVEGLVNASEVPVDLREEIVNICDEHGGLELLASYFKIGFNTLKHWYKKWRICPTMFRDSTKIVKSSKMTKSEKAVRSIFDSSPEPKPTKKRKILNEDSSASDLIMNDLDASAQNAVLSAQAMIRSKNRLDGDAKAKVKELFPIFNDTRKLAIVLGISEKLIELWCSAN